MMTTARLLATLLAAASVLSLAPARAQTAPASAPVAPVRPITDTYFGTTVTDPYRWMEKLDDPETKAWFRGQADYTTATLSQIPGRDAMLARIQSLDQGTTFVTGAQAFGPYVFYEKRRPQDNNYKLYVRQGFSGAERLLVDPEAMTTASGVHTSLDYFTPSPDGKYVAYALSPGGSEDSVLHVLDTGSSQPLPDSITRAQFGNVSWLADNQSFAYVRLQQLAAGQNPNDKESDSKVFRHRLNTDADAQDVLLLGKGVNPNVPYEDIDVPTVIYSPAAPKYVFGYDGRGVQNEVTLYVAPYSSLGGDAAAIPWKKICDFSDDVTGFDAHGDDVFLLSHKGASRYQIFSVKADAPDLTTAKLIMPQGKTVLRGLSVAADALYVHALDAGVGRLSRVPFGGKPQAIPLPFTGALDPTVFTDPQQPGALFNTEAGTHPPAWYIYNPKSGLVADTGLQPSIALDLSHVAQAEVMAKAADGTLVPLSILYPKGMKRDGSHPTLVDGYGSYGIVSDLNFNPRGLAWIEHGGVYAVAHVRGGGELGEDWHRAGQKSNKPNTWGDLNACGQYLVDQGYTKPSRLACLGGSAGGITVGRALTTRPDLWAAVIDEVGVSNATRSEFSPNGPDNVPEFGTVADEQGFKDLYAMDSYLHVTDGTKYPAVLLMTGINDPRVPSWEPAKMTARLQAATASGKPVLLRVDYDAGHGIGSTKSQHERELADIFSFLLWQFGDPAFQPK